MDEKNRNKLDILYIQFLNFSIFPHLYSIYTPSSANSANFTNIGFHKARVFRSNIPLTFDSSDTKKYPSNNGVRSGTLVSCVSWSKKKKREGKKYISAYIQRTKGNNSTARRSSSSFKIVPATVLNLKELKDLRQCDKCSCTMFGRVLSSCKWRPQRNAFPSMGGAPILLHQSPLSIYQRTRVFLRAFTIHTG